MVEANLVFEIQFFGSEALLHLGQLPIRESIFHRDGNLAGDLHEKLDIAICPDVIRGPADFERSEGPVAGDQWN